MSSISRAASPSSHVIFDIWQLASTRSAMVDVDLEALRVPHSDTDPIHDFFGVHIGIYDSSHDTPHALTPHEFEHDSEGFPPPPYVEVSDLPSYASVVEPPTLATHLFKVGFLFPPFWLAGAMLLFSPLEIPEDWESSKTEAEKQELIEFLRRTERKWAKYCLISFIIFVIALLSIASTVALVMRS